MDTADLDESSHQHDQSDAHQQHCPPMSHYPLCDVLVQLWVEDGLLESGQGSVCVHQATLHEHVAVSFEVVAG